MSQTVAEHHFPGGAVLALVQGDLTEARLSAIVNAANPHLQHGGGLAAAIVRRGGPRIQQESDEWVRRNGPAAPGRPAITGAGSLPCGAVIHAVGPVWGEGGEDRKLALAVRSALELASANGFVSLGLPAISTGIYGFPVERAAPILLGAIVDYFASDPSTSLNRVEVTLFDTPTLDVFTHAFAAHFPTQHPAGAPSAA